MLLLALLFSRRVFRRQELPLERCRYIAHANVYPAGIAATGNVGQVLVWGTIVPNQNAGYNGSAQVRRQLGQTKRRHRHRVGVK
jgi:hypothetical protein